MEVQIDDRQKTKKINEEDVLLIKKVVKTCLIEENMDANIELSLSFVNNEEIKKLNKNFRNKDYPTDVLSFPINERIEDLTILGDIVISVDKVIEQAEEYKHSFKRELVYLIVHGMFHLFGYDHIDIEDKEKMRKKEKKVLKKLAVYK